MSTTASAGIISPNLNKIKPLYKLTTHQRGKLLMDFGSVLYESMDRVATITLNRPERFNAISENICLTILPQLLSRLFLKEIPGSKN